MPSNLIKHTLALLALLLPALASAHDFEVDGIYYNKLSSNTVAVTWKSPSSNTAAYSGSVTIPSIVVYNSVEYTVTSINSYTFSYCKLLTEVNIPSTVSSIGAWAFAYCSSLTSIHIPSSVVIISDYMFYNCFELREVNIPDNVTSIGQGSFQFCESLTYINIPNSVTTIGSQAFDCCTSLNSISIPNSVISIGQYALNNCKSLTEIFIPSSVNSLGWGPFSGCSSLHSIDVDENNQVYCSIDGVLFDKSKTHLVQFPAARGGYYTVPNSVTSIGNYAFYWCSTLTKLDVPNSTTSIGEYAMYYCMSIAEIKIPSSVSYIGRQTFYGWLNLNKLICLAETPPSLGSSVFGSVDKDACTLYVPEHSIDLYKSAEQWKDFFNIEPIDEDDTIPGDLNGDGVITIADLNLLIEKAMGGNPAGINEDAADVNGDGKITIADVNALINKIMS